MRIENKTKFKSLTLKDGTVIHGDVRIQRTCDHDLHTFVVVDNKDAYPIESVLKVSLDGGERTNILDLAIQIGFDNGVPEEVTEQLLHDYIANGFDSYVENSGAGYEDACEDEEEHPNLYFGDNVSFLYNGERRQGIVVRESDEDGFQCETESHGEHFYHWHEITELEVLE